jgi:hypothetical protein
MTLSLGSAGLKSRVSIAIARAAAIGIDPAISVRIDHSADP